VAALLLVVGLYLATLINPEKTTERWQVFGGIVAGVLSLTYFIQKQKLEELNLFKEIFAGFNARYDKMNEALNRILTGDPNIELSKSECDTLYNYFNLCGEEYLYFSLGYIYPEVWRAWCNGMKIFRRNSRIKCEWDKELETGSYYGLNFIDEKKAEQDGESPTCDIMMTGTKVLAAT